METIKVNMNPNPLDVQTIHASQNDGEARQWEFELHNNGDAIDSSSISDQLVFKSYKGGTEQILPENGAVPVTAPFVGDIKYPDATRTNQEFLYRQSPTEEDGLAKITDIKGQTIKWNQHVKNGVYGAYGLTCTTADGTMTISGTSADETEARRDFRASVTDGLISVGHKILLLGGSSDYRIRLQGTYTYEDGSGLILEASSGAEYQIIINMNIAPNTTYNFTIHPQIFDLTQMFGAGNEPSTVEEFTSLFPLYYPYNSGSLIPFNGNGIKTVGKNLFQNNAVNKTQFGITFTINDDKSITVNGTATGVAYITHETGLSAPNIKKGESLILSGSLNLPQSKAYLQLVYTGVSTGTIYSFVSTNDSSVSINATEDMTLRGIYFNIASGATVNNMTAYPMLRYADTDSTYEPYTSSTLSLPVSTYFPTGMKSAGSVYDELLPTKAITRIGAVDLGLLDWTSAGTNTQGVSRMRSSSLRNVIFKSDVSNVANVICAKYVTLSANGTYSKVTGISVDGAGDILVYDPNYNVSASVTAFKEAMTGVYLYYELATPTETSFTTASLVTENGEIPLSNEDGTLIGKCTEQLSENPGFIDAKIKLSDGDGTCYSNKLQLHVERSPQ